VQICGAVKESHVPAQATPLLATVRTAVLLDANVTGVVIVVPLLFCGVAVKVWVVLPTSNETSAAGARVIFAGAGKTVFLVGPLLLQPVKARSRTPIGQITANPTKPNDLPMHPPRPVHSRGELSGIDGKPQV
jgi:hypothetical protein